MSLYRTQALQMAARAMHLPSGNQEHAVVTVMTGIQDIYLSDARVINSAEKPPTQSTADRRRRVDSVSLLAPNPWPSNWMFKTCGLWECKKAGATSPKDVEVCEAQLVDAAQRVFLNTGHTGVCYLFSIIGDYWKVFIYSAPGQYMECLTGEADDRNPIDSYMDITDPLEAAVIDEILRRFRRSMGLSRDVRADVRNLYPDRQKSLKLCFDIIDADNDGLIYDEQHKKYFRIGADGTSKIWSIRQPRY